MRTPTPGGDPVVERLGALERRLAELERRVNSHGTMLDAEGNIIAAADAITGVGLGRPFLPQTWAPARLQFDGLFYACGATSPETIWKTTILKQHPSILLAVETQADAGTAGTLRVTVAGTVVKEVPFGSTQTRHVFSLPVPGAHLDPVGLTVQLWRTAGTGLVRCWPQDTSGVAL